MTKNKLSQKVLTNMKLNEVNKLTVLENKKNKLFDEMSKAQKHATIESRKKGPTNPDVLKLNDIGFKQMYIAYKAQDDFVAFREKMRKNMNNI